MENQTKQNIPVKLTIRSFIQEIAAKKGEEGETQSLLFHCKGNMAIDDRQITVSYQEDTSTDMGNTETTLAFLRGKNDSFMMAREGDISCTMAFSLENPRHLCTYKTPFAPFSFVICTKKLSCDVTEKGGRINVEYGMELRGVYVEFHRMSILISPEKEHYDASSDPQCD